ncbi:hypothetical protein [Flintibacter sp. KGMB00164]|uniref:hypothetical protein n=1 Tax=Flintibacter sp. KGMB00164 TaxID=2610895 RepID=UPI00124765E7|nr:hypothetical protein [Flintibacter sp. KGMB00164]
MMDAAWAALLAKYGQRVVLHQGDSTVDARAFLQPIREKGQAQSLPSPLGWQREDRFLYLGDPNHPLSDHGDWVEFEGAGYAVVSAHPVHVGISVSHIWAVLRPRDTGEEAGA